MQQQPSETRLNHIELCSLTSWKALAIEAMHIAGLAECSAWAAQVCPQNETNLPAPVVVTEVCRNLQVPLGTEIGMQEHDITCTFARSIDARYQYILHMSMHTLTKQCNKHIAEKNSTMLPSCLHKREGSTQVSKIGVHARTEGMNEG